MWTRRNAKSDTHTLNNMGDMMESNLLKIARAVDGDDLFKIRVKVACELAGVEYDRRVLLSVAQAVVSNIAVDDALTVCTNAVTDDEIIAALPEKETGE